MARFFRIAIFIAFIFSTSSAFAACHTVNPANAHNGDGTTWGAAASNGAAGAFNAIPATLTRGDVYYLADGTYAGYTFNTADSGTTTSEIRKAQPADHCTATGWSTSTMGSAQAVFAGPGISLTIASDYFTVNGNGTSTTVGCGGAPGSTVSNLPPTPSDCGIFVDNYTADASPPIFIGNPSTSAPTKGFTLEYVELRGGGDNINDQHEVFEPYYEANDGGTFLHDYFHYAGCVFLQDGGDGRTVAYSYFWGTEVNGADPVTGCHGQAEFYNGSDSNGVNHGNVYRDITGTAIWTFAWSAGTHTNWVFYDNVIFQSSPAASWSPYIANGILACINSGVNCNGFVFSQNTVVNVTGTGSSTGIANENTGSYTVENNVWYQGFTPAFSAGTGGTYTQDHNSFLNSGATCASGTANVCDNSAPNPFTRWTTGNFTLASDASNWNNRVSLSSPYNTDAAGNVFTSNRGAYEYAGSTAVTAVAPQPPSGLVATVQ